MSFVDAAFLFVETGRGFLLRRGTRRSSGRETRRLFARVRCRVRYVNCHGDLDRRLRGSDDFVAKRPARRTFRRVFGHGRKRRRRFILPGYHWRHRRQDNVLVILVLPLLARAKLVGPLRRGRRGRVAGRLPNGFGGYLWRDRRVAECDGVCGLKLDGTTMYRLGTTRRERHIWPSESMSAGARFAPKDTRFVDHRSRVGDDDAAADLVRPFEVHRLREPRPVGAVGVRLCDGR